LIEHNRGHKAGVAAMVEWSAVSRNHPAISPMHPTLVREPFHRHGWIFEEKYDGWRMLAFKDGAGVRLVSRNGRDHTARFSDIASAVARLHARMLIRDGEVCAFDRNLVSHIYSSSRAQRSRQRHSCSWRSRNTSSAIL
jgi:ATP-dependent DNA ligase